MRDYWLTQEILKGIGFAYIALTLIALALALWLPKRWWGKLIAVAVVIGIFSILPRQAQKEIAQDQVKADEFKVRYDKAKALFDERCKTAGEKIYRTVENVEGVLLMKVRPEEINFSDQYAVAELFSNDSSGDSYIGSFVRAKVVSNPTPQLLAKGRNGFGWVEAINTADKSFQRYVGAIKFHPNGEPYFALEKISAVKSNAKFGVTFEDVSTREDRDHWIAGGQIQIIDFSTNAVVAERIGYLFDSGLGSTGGFRTPWAWAQSYGPRCPSTAELTASFVSRVLKATSGE